VARCQEVLQSKVLYRSCEMSVIRSLQELLGEVDAYSSARVRAVGVLAQSLFQSHVVI